VQPQGTPVKKAQFKCLPSVSNFLRFFHEHTRLIVTMMFTKEEEDRIVACCDDPDRHLLSSDEYASEVVKYKETMAVKFGEPVSDQEARNQRHARSILDPSIVRVPEVYHCFQRGEIGYLVMEYIEGEPCPDDVRPDIIDKAANIVTHLRTHHGTIPGPVGGGLARALLFENEPIEIQDLADLETYFNDRLLVEKKGPVKFEESELVFCHNDIAPRNVILCKDGLLALIDWAHGLLSTLFRACFVGPLLVVDKTRAST
jgi:serine/threonine protein kinase